MKWLLRLAEVSVWARAGVPAAAWRFRGIFRVVLPLTYLFFGYFGVVGSITGVRSMQAYFGPAGTIWWAAAIAGASFAALVGAAFPRLWAVELVASVMLVGLVSSYVVLQAVKIVTDFHTSATAGLVIILILLAIWRALDLGFVAWTRGHGGHQ